MTIRKYKRKKMTSAKKPGTQLISMAGFKHYEMNKISTRLKTLGHAEKFFQRKISYSIKEMTIVQNSRFIVLMHAAVYSKSGNDASYFSELKMVLAFCNRPCGMTFFISYKSNFKWFFKI